MVFVLGIGNRLLSDDGAGPAVIDMLESDPARPKHVTYRDGGTIGLALLPEIEDSSAFIAVDAAELGAPPGTVLVFEAEAMDAQLSGRKRTVHEVALSDMLGAAALAGTLPARRALVAIQPETVGWGMSPSPAVAAAIPQACAAISGLVEKWAAQS
ncbi:MAG: hydrogenase maturation protease [Rhodomicrobium sp.]